MTMVQATPLRRWWRAVRTPLASLGVLVALFIGCLVASPHVPGYLGLFQDWQDRRWHPGAWALTADDFPSGTATTLEVQDAWLTDRSKNHPDRHPAIAKLPGLRHLPWSNYEAAPGLMRSGVQVGELDVFTSIFEVEEESAVERVSYKLSSRKDHHERDVFDETGTRPVPEGVSVNEPLFTDPALGDAIHLGDRTVTTRRDGWIVFEFDDGPHGYFGVAGTTTDVVTGQPRQVAAAIALRGGHLVAIGLSAPSTADVDWEGELGRLVALVDAKMAADPDGNGLTWL